MADLPSIESAKIESKEYRDFFESKEDEKFKFLSAGIIDKYGPEASEVIEAAKSKILADREAGAVAILEEMFTEKYGPEAHEIVEKARQRMVFFREPMNLMTFAEVVASKYGPEVYKVIRKAIRDFWEVRAKSMLDEFKITERDAIGAIKVLSLVHGDIGEVVEATPKRAVREERYCVFTDIFTPFWCELASVSAMEGICAAVNPKLTVTYEKYLTRKGDDCCRIVVEQKD